jgi:putative DNA primase/helicase
MWAGLPDPLGPSQALKDVDPEIEALRVMIDAWDEAFNKPDALRLEKVPKPYKLSDVIAKSQSSDEGAAKLRDALNYVCSEKVTSLRLSGWLRRNRDRIIDGRRFVLAEHDSTSKIGKWKLETC